METDKEILETYKDTIEKNIETLILERKITDAREKASFSRCYRENFVKGFKEGSEEKKKTIAKMMLAKGLDIPMVSEISGLSLEELNTLTVS